MLSDEERENLIKKLGYCEQEYEQNGYLSVGKFKAIKQAIELIENQQKEIEELKTNKGYHIGFIDGGIAKRYEYEDKIKAKIEEVDENGYWEFLEKRDEDKCKDILQSLLEKE